MALNMRNIIIFGILFLAFIGMLWNSISNGEPWEHSLLMGLLAFWVGTELWKEFKS